MPRATSYNDLTWKDRQERSRRLAELLTMELVSERLRGPLGDTAYRTAGREFDWRRFVQEGFPEVQPPLGLRELFGHLRRARPKGGLVPRRLVWWIVRVYAGADDPDAWLLAEREQAEQSGIERPIERLAAQLNAAGGEGGVGLQAKDLYHYMARLRKTARQARAEEIAQLLPLKEIHTRLRAALRARQYRMKTMPSAFDWRRCARECFPEVQPPLDAHELFQLLQRGRPEGGALPRGLVWWAVRLGVSAEDPDAWLLAERKQAEQAGSVRPAERIAAQLEGAASSEEIEAYIAALRRSSAAGAAETES